MRSKYYDCLIDFDLIFGASLTSFSDGRSRQHIQAYHQYGVGSRPALLITKRMHSPRSRK
jgi:hypothetical protein